jgi:hypothetical protein
MKYLMLVTFVFMTVGCVHAEHISDSQATWVSLTSVLSEKFYFCENKKNSSETKPNPVCYEADIYYRGGKNSFATKVDEKN